MKFYFQSTLRNDAAKIFENGDDISVICLIRKVCIQKVSIFAFHNDIISKYILHLIVKTKDPFICSANPQDTSFQLGQAAQKQQHPCCMNCKDVSCVLAEKIKGVKE